MSEELTKEFFKFQLLNTNKKQNSTSFIEIFGLLIFVFMIMIYFNNNNKNNINRKIIYYTINHRSPAEIKDNLLLIPMISNVRSPSIVSGT